MGMRWQVIEDNGGGLHLAVLEDGHCIYYASWYETRPSALRADVQALREGEHPIQDRWEMQERLDPQVAYDGLTSHEYGWTVVADQDGVHYNRMGAAAKTAFCARVNIVEVGAPGETHAERIDDFAIPLEPLDITDGALVQTAMIEAAQRDHVIVPTSAGGQCVVQRHNDGRIEIAVTVEREEAAEEVRPQDRFARALGFDAYDDLLAASRSIITEGDTDWYVTPLPTGQWAAWDDAEIALDRCEILPTCEDAFRHHVGAYMDAHAQWEREERPSWDKLGETAVAHHLTVEIGGRKYHAQIAEAETGECSVAATTENPSFRFEGQFSFLINSKSAGSFDEAEAMVIAAIAKAIAGDRA